MIPDPTHVRFTSATDARILSMTDTNKVYLSIDANRKLVLFDEVACVEAADRH